MRFTRDPARADLLVDMSNVASRDVLGGRTVSISRLLRAVEVFEHWSGIEDANVFGVADQSLFPRLAAESDRAQLRTWVAQGLVEALPGADERLLELVELSGGVMMTWDRFEGHRDAYPWIQGDTQHFVLVHERDGRLTIGLRDMGVVTNRRVSERAEIDALKAAHLLGPAGGPDASVLTRWWKCPDRRCSLFSADHSEGQPLPVRNRGVLLCSLHRLQLVDDGPRPPQVQLKVLIQGRVAERVIVEDGQPPLVIGRGSDADLDLTSMLPSEERELVSRRHASVWLSAGVLWARDEDSTNGTVLVAAERELARTLAPGEDVVVKSSDALSLAGIAQLERSGRRFPVALGRRGARVVAQANKTRSV